jgi:hypothetical protein
VFVITAMLWLFQFFWDDVAFHYAPNVFMAVIYFATAIGFMVYGGRLYQLLKRFPIESRGRKSKLQEV